MFLLADLADPLSVIYNSLFISSFLVPFFLLIRLLSKQRERAEIKFLSLMLFALCSLKKDEKCNLWTSQVIVN